MTETIEPEICLNSLFFSFFFFVFVVISNKTIVSALVVTAHPPLHPLSATAKVGIHRETSPNYKAIVNIHLPNGKEKQGHCEAGDRKISSTNHLCEFLHLFNSSNATKERGMQSKPSNTDPQHQ